MKTIHYLYERLIVKAPDNLARMRAIHKREGLRGLFKQLIRKVYRQILFRIDPDIFDRLQYKDWQKNVEKRYLNRDYMRELNDFVGADIRFSIVFPVWNKSLILLDKALSSVLKQLYRNWDLCISDGSTEKTEETRQFLGRFKKDHPDRVKLAFLKDPSGINLIENSNHALSLADGDFCVFLDCDDELSPNRLLELALEVKKNPEVDFIYSDFDKIDWAGHRFNPSFWPDWSPHTILSQMYTTHVTCFRTDLLKKR